MDRRKLIIAGVGALLFTWIFRKKIMRYWQAVPDKAKPWIPLFEQMEAKYNLPKTLLTRIAWIESRFNPDAYNPTGATGMMQIIPKWHPGVDAKNPAEAIPYAAKYLADLHKMFGGDWRKAIAGYNWGPGNVKKAVTAHGLNWRAQLPKETADYLRQVEDVIDLA